MQNLHVEHLDLIILLAVHTLTNQPQQTKPQKLWNF